MEDNDTLEVITLEPEYNKINDTMSTLNVDDTISTLSVENNLNIIALNETEMRDNTGN